MPLAFGLWPVACGIWHLAFGIWHLAFGIWHLAFGVWRLAFGVWCLVFGFVLDVQVLTWVLTFRGITNAEEGNILGCPAMDGGTRER